MESSKPSSTAAACIVQSLQPVLGTSLSNMSLDSEVQIKINETVKIDIPIEINTKSDENSTQVSFSNMRLTGDMKICLDQPIKLNVPIECELSNNNEPTSSEEFKTEDRPTSPVLQDHYAQCNLTESEPLELVKPKEEALIDEIVSEAKNEPSIDENTNEINEEAQIDKAPIEENSEQFPEPSELTEIPEEDLVHHENEPPAEPSKELEPLVFDDPKNYRVEVHAKDLPDMDKESMFFKFYLDYGRGWQQISGNPEDAENFIRTNTKPVCKIWPNAVFLSKDQIEASNHLKVEIWYYEKQDQFNFFFGHFHSHTKYVAEKMFEGGFKSMKLEGEGQPKGPEIDLIVKNN